ncbi:MAG: septal ring lytic transglycosylase RlpA family protein [Deltaproteobacteria bacterium]|jgi:rare lipoprotein A|nr:septal ring lytic transglycosylase RlpA family protein [Deltaproteobacteria bacterium]
MRKLALGSVLLLITLALEGCATQQSGGQAPLKGLAPYTQNGVRYTPVKSWEGFSEDGVASWYGPPYHGRKTASGETFDTYAKFTAAHKTLPFNICVHVSNKENGQDVVVKINDRGPFVAGRILDLSKVAADKLGVTKGGIARVHMETVALANSDGSCDGAPGVSVWAKIQGFFTRLF